MPPSLPQSEGQILTDILRRIQTTTQTTINIPVATSVTTSISVSVPTSAPRIKLSSHILSFPSISRQSSPNSIITITISISSSLCQPRWKPPTIEEFKANIERRRGQEML
jgi:hypothetical protein